MDLSKFMNLFEDSGKGLFLDFLGLLEVENEKQRLADDERLSRWDGDNWTT